jgi:hypothetical protein
VNLGIHTQKMEIRVAVSSCYLSLLCVGIGIVSGSVPHNGGLFTGKNESGICRDLVQKFLTENWTNALEKPLTYNQKIYFFENFESSLVALNKVLGNTKKEEIIGNFSDEAEILGLRDNDRTLAQIKKNLQLPQDVDLKKFLVAFKSFNEFKDNTNEKNCDQIALPPHEIANNLIKETYEPIYDLKESLTTEQVASRANEMSRNLEWLEVFSNQTFASMNNQVLRKMSDRRIYDFKDLMMLECYEMAERMLFRKERTCPDLEQFRNLWKKLWSIRGLIDANHQFPRTLLRYVTEEEGDKPVWKSLKESLKTNVDELSVDLERACKVNRNRFLKKIKEFLNSEPKIIEERPKKTEEEQKETEEEPKKTVDPEIESLKSDFDRLADLYWKYDPEFKYRKFDAFVNLVSIRLALERLRKETNVEALESFFERVYKNFFRINAALNKPGWVEKHDYRSVELSHLNQIAFDKTIKDSELKLFAYKIGQTLEKKMERKSEEVMFPPLDQVILEKLGFTGRDLKKQLKEIGLKRERPQSQGPTDKSIQILKSTFTSPPPPIKKEKPEKVRERRKSILLAKPVIKKPKTIESTTSKDRGDKFLKRFRKILESELPKDDEKNLILFENLKKEYDEISDAHGDDPRFKKNNFIGALNNTTYQLVLDHFRSNETHFYSIIDRIYQNNFTVRRLLTPDWAKQKDWVFKDVNINDWRDLKLQHMNRIAMDETKEKSELRLWAYQIGQALYEEFKEREKPLWESEEAKEKEYAKKENEDARKERLYLAAKMGRRRWWGKQDMFQPINREILQKLGFMGKTLEDYVDTFTPKKEETKVEETSARPRTETVSQRKGSMAIKRLSLVPSESSIESKQPARRLRSKSVNAGKPGKLVPRPIEPIRRKVEAPQMQAGGEMKLNIPSHTYEDVSTREPDSLEEPLIRRGEKRTTLTLPQSQTYNEDLSAPAAPRGSREEKK